MICTNYKPWNYNSHCLFLFLFLLPTVPDYSYFGLFTGQSSSSSSWSTNFIATQVLNKTSGLLCVTYYTNVNATVADSLCCRMICGVRNIWQHTECVRYIFKGKRIVLKHFYILYSRLTDSPAMPIYLSLVFFAFLRSSRTRSSSWTNSTSSFAFCRTVHMPNTNEERIIRYILFL